jgi:hypothetical protein
MGLDWWSRDPFFTGEQKAVENRDDEVEELQRRIAALEEQLERHRPELAAGPSEADR